jgi:anti-sigma factor ChrR (cupin superfamily)
MTDDNDAVSFDPLTALALAAALPRRAPDASVRRRLLERIAAPPAGFRIVRGDDDSRWMPHPVPGIRMKILALDRPRGYATLLLDVAPGTHFPPHHHGAAEECYVVSGTLFNAGQKLYAGDFIHADADTDHGELWTEEGCRVILVVPPDEHLPPTLQKIE